MNTDATKLRSFKKMILTSIFGGLAFTLIQICSPIVTLPTALEPTSAPQSASPSPLPAEPIGVSEINQQIAEIKAKLTQSQEDLVTKKVAEEALAATDPTKATATAARQASEKTVVDFQTTLDNLIKQREGATNKIIPKMIEWIIRFFANSGLVFGLQLLAFLGQYKEFAGILRTVAKMLNIDEAELPANKPKFETILAAVPMAIENEVRKAAEPIQQEKELAEAAKERVETEKKEVEAAKEQIVREKGQLEIDLDKKNKRMKSLRLGPVAGSDDRFCRVLLLGSGDTGKTELIYQMLRYDGNHADRPIRDNKTYDLRTYWLLHLASFSGITQTPDVFQATAIELTDYRGQSPGPLFRNLVEKRHASDGGDFDAIFLIVDLFSTPKGKVRKRARPDQERVSVQESLWRERLGDFVHLSENLKYICLIINKCDMLDNPGTARDTAFEAYESLTDHIRTLQGVPNFERIACSLHEGWMQHDIRGLPEKDGGVFPFLLSRMVANFTTLSQNER